MRAARLILLGLLTYALGVAFAGCGLFLTNQYVMKNPRTDQIIVCRAEGNQGGNPWLNAQRCA
jgi:hypothetical protein